MSPLMIPIIGMMIPIIAILAKVYMRSMEMKERQLTAMGENTAEKAAQYATRVAELEQRVRVLERIATDGGIQTAAQIEALARFSGQLRDDAGEGSVNPFEFLLILLGLIVIYQIIKHKKGIRTERTARSCRRRRTTPKPGRFVTRSASSRSASRCSSGSRSRRRTACARDRGSAQPLRAGPASRHRVDGRADAPALACRPARRL